jgi:ribosomal protein L10
MKTEPRRNEIKKIGQALENQKGRNRSKLQVFRGALKKRAIRESGVEKRRKENDVGHCGLVLESNDVMNTPFHRLMVRVVCQTRS